MTHDELIAQTVSTWQRHNDILLYLLAEIPEAGFAAKPTGSRGRDVGRQFDHLQRVRVGWLHHHETGERLKLPRQDEGPVPTREALHEALSASGRDVATWLGKALRGEVHPRMFGKNPVRWMGYLIAHESHHRGQIMLALKQNDMRMPEEVALNGLWGKWIFGKDA